MLVVTRRCHVPAAGSGMAVATSKPRQIDIGWLGTQRACLRLCIGVASSRRWPPTAAPLNTAKDASIPSIATKDDIVIIQPGSATVQLYAVYDQLAPQILVKFEIRYPTGLIG